MIKLDLKITSKDKIFFFISILVLSLGYVSTPILIRSIIDGFLVIEDVDSIKFSLIILIVLELFNLLTNFVFNKTCDEIVSERVIFNKIKILNTIKHTTDNNDLVKKILSSQLEFIARNKIKYYWMRQKDVCVLLLLSIVAMLISYEAGILICSIILMYIGLSYLISYRTKNVYKTFKNLEELELLKIDKYLKSNLNQMTPSSIKLVSDKELYKYKMSRLKSIGFDLQSSLRVLILLVVVSLGSFYVIDGTWEMGIIWSLLVVSFRISGPVRGIANWIIESKQMESQLNKIEVDLSSLL